MKAQEFKDMNMEELEEQLKEKRSQLAKLRFDVSSRQLKNYNQIGETRRDIARILTVRSQMNQEVIENDVKGKEVVTEQTKDDKNNKQ